MRILLKKFSLFFGFCLLIFFLTHRLFFFSSSFFEQISAKVSYPFLKLSNSVASYIQEKTERKAHYDQLLTQHTELKNVHENLIAENIQLKALLQYDKQSKDLIDFQQRYNLEDKTFAKILVKNIDDSEHYFLVNRGTRDGVKKNMVALYKFQIVGRVSTVFDRYSKVILITDQNCKIGAYATNTNALGIAQGSNKINAFSLNYVSHLQTIETNDLVLSNGQGLIFPEGFCLGKVIKHSLKEKALYHDVTIEPLIDLKNLKFCMIVDQTKINLF